MANSSKNHEHVVFVRHHLVGGLNPLQKYQTNWIISLSRGENQKILANHQLPTPFS